MIQTQGLSRTFKTRAGPVEAVRGVDLRVAAGEIVGLLGPNGAGKTTIQRMLSTLLSPTAGEATVAGCDLRRDPIGVRRRIGYVPQGGSTNEAALVLQELVVQARLHGLAVAEARVSAESLCQKLELQGLEQRQVRSLSGGQRRRLDIALGLVHSPKLVFLDEPSTGLDPQSRGNLWNHIRRLKQEAGATVLLTTHYLDEADALADRILIVDKGRVVAEGTPAELKRRISGDIVTLTVDGSAESARAVAVIQPGARETQTVGEHVLRVTVEHGDVQALSLMRALETAGIRVASLQVAHPSLDDVFLTLTGRSLRESNGTEEAAA